VKQNFDLKSFKKNPVFLDSHNYSSIEKIIGKIDRAKVKDNKFQGDIIFNLDNPLGVLARNMVENGFLKATSIGFIPKDFDEKGNITKSEMLEVSAVSVPANPEALFVEKSIEVEGAEVPDKDPEVEEKVVVEVVNDSNECIPEKSKKSLYTVISEMKKKDTDTLMKIASGLTIQIRMRKNENCSLR